MNSRPLDGELTSDHAEVDVSSTKYWETSFRAKRWSDMNADEKAEWVRAEPSA